MTATTSPVKSAERALAVVEFVADRGAVTFAEILDGLGLPRSSMHGLLHTLAQVGWLERREDRRYVLGLRTWEVGQKYGGHRELVDLARPLMDRVRRETGETVQMARLDGAENIYIAISHSPHPMRLASSVGVRLPAHATGIGKALLSLLDDAEVRGRLVAETPLARMTARTVTDVEDLLRLVDAARRSGYAIDDEEYLEGCVCVAVPLGRDPRTGGAPVALSITVPTARVRPPWPATYLESLRAAATEIQRVAQLTA